MCAMDGSALRNRHSGPFETLAPLAQWTLLESAFQPLRMPAASRYVPIVYIMAVYVLTGAPWCMAWLLVSLAGVAVGRRAAQQFDMRTSDASAVLCAQRYTRVMWFQAASIGVGGFGATWDSNPIFCLLVACPIGFAVMEACATAVLAPAARAQTLILCAPLGGCCLLHGAWLPGSLYHAVIGGLLTLWALGSWPLANAAAARIKSLALTVAEGNRAQSSLAGPLALPPAVHNFQRLLGSDPVTGLPNHHRFTHLLAQESDRAYRSEAPLSLVLVGWDEFEPLSACRTQAEIDTMVCDIAKRLRATLRRHTDVLASLGSGRFGVLLPGTDAFGTTIVARNLHQALTMPDQAAEPAASVSIFVSIGSATYRGKGPLPEAQLLDFAEQALRDARYTGGNRIRRYDPIANIFQPPRDTAPDPKQPAPVAAPPNPHATDRTSQDFPVITKAALGLELRH